MSTPSQTAQIEMLTARVAELENALAESVKLQSHYAKLLNMHDGGKRLTFFTMEAWLARLAELERTS